MPRTEERGRTGAWAEGARLDPRFEEAGAEPHRDRAEGRMRPQDRPEVSRARPGGAGLWPASAPRLPARSLRGLSARTCHGLPRSQRGPAAAGDPGDGLRGRLHEGDRLPAEGTSTGTHTVRAPLRDASRSPGAGRLRGVHGVVHRRARYHAQGLAVLDHPGSQPLALGPVRCQPEPAIGPALHMRRRSRPWAACRRKFSTTA